MKYYLAIDLGATSGRHILAHEENGEMVLEEIHRFLTGMHPSKDDLVWDIPTLFNEIKAGIKKAFNITKNIESISIDSWGVDYVLLNNDKPILPYYAYRNKRLDNAYKKVHDIIPFKDLYLKTGIQFATFNTIYQLHEDKLEGRLDNATDYLMIPSYFSYLLTGKKVHEYTNESTTGLLNAKEKTYDMDIIHKLGLPERLFKDIQEPGTIIGYLTKEMEEELGGSAPVIACASHDTGSAFEAVDSPLDAVIISSGTWSLVGVKTLIPITSLKSYEHNFTNEGGVGYYRYLKNIMGMWLVNEVCRQKNLNVVDVVKHLDDVTYCETFDVADQSLLNPENMEEAIKTLLRHNPPKDDYELFASIYHSLALSYKKAVEELEELNNTKYNYIYIVGGGAKNKYLNRLTEEVSGRKVVALPIEATALGNIKVQQKIK